MVNIVAMVKMLRALTAVEEGGLAPEPRGPGLRSWTEDLNIGSCWRHTAVVGTHVLLLYAVNTRVNYSTIRSEVKAGVGRELAIHVMAISLSTAGACT